MSALALDFRIALRSLRKHPGFALITVLTLALGIGANTAIWSVVHGVVLRPLDLPQSDELLRLWATAPDRGAEQTAVSYTKFELLRQQKKGFFTGLSAGTSESFALTAPGVDMPEQVTGRRVTAEFFATLGLHLRHGRAFSTEEDQPGGALVTVLGERLWQHRFGGDPELVGRTVQLGGRAFTVVGILEAAPYPYQDVQAWVPRVFEPSFMEPSAVEIGAGYLALVARLADGVSPAVAREHLASLDATYAELFPDHVDVDNGLSMLPLRDEFVGDLRTSSYLLAAAVALVLLIACANVAHLVLTRLTSRRHEVALRAALGAKPGTVVRQFLVESWTLCLLAGIAGTGLAAVSLQVLRTGVASILPRATEIQLDGRVLAATAGVTLLTGILLAVPPVWQVLTTSASEAFRQGGAGRGGVGGQRGRQSLLIVAEVSLAVALLAVASMLLLSFQRLQRVEPGFDPNGVAIASLSLPSERYPEFADQGRFYTRLAEQLRACPSIEHASVAYGIPFSAGAGTRIPFAIDGGEPVPLRQQPLAGFRLATPDYLATLHIPLIAGRTFDSRDMQPQPAPVILINQTMARRHFDGKAVGRFLRFGRRGEKSEIVGVIGDMHTRGLGEMPEEEIYFPMGPAGRPAASILARSAHVDGVQPDVATLHAEIRHAVHAADPQLAVIEPTTLDALLSDSIADRRLILTLVGCFSALALALAMIGIYSVISFSVSQRTGEIGLRMALGADARRVRQLVLRQGLGLIVSGLLLGLASAAGAGRLLTSTLFDVDPLSAAVLLPVALLFLVFGLLACLLPARRATRIDPLEALRQR